MSRRFSADNSEIRFNIVTATNFTGAHSLACVVRRRATGAWHALIGHHSSAGAGGLGLEFSNGNVLSYTPDNVTGSVTSTTFTSTTDWLIVVLTKTSGTTLPRFHWVNLTTPAGWTHQNGNQNTGNPASQSGGTMRTGEYADTDDANVNLAVIAEWGVALSDGQCEELSVNSRTSDFWNNTGGNPVALYELNQAASTDSVPDLAGGGATWSLTNGTTVEGSTDPPSWNYNGIGSVAEVPPPNLVMAPYQGAF